MPNLKELAGQVIDAVRGHVARAIAPINERLAQLEAAIKAIPAGKDGAPGRDGKDGAAGKDGDVGPRGEKGDQGPAGVDGKDGAQGLPGEKGADGKDGRDGVDGKPGKDGARGEKGEKGDPGEVGARGADGAAGERGADGVPGEPGQRGEKGEKGDAGVAGARGEKGERGEQGPAGAQGERGLPGERGEPGAGGARGEKGDAGKDGRDGRDGKDGTAGAPGRDALDLDILPAIDENRSYPRGTWARHRKGLWRAAADTQGMRNWECMVAGVAELRHESVSEREIEITSALSDGEPVVHRIKLEHPLDRGVYRPDEKYSKGDGVTFGGHWWIAKKDDPEFKPGDPADNPGGMPTCWRLAVKRGRDGKGAEPRSK